MMNQNFGGLFDLEYGSPLPDQIRSGDRFPVFGSNGQVGRHDDYLIDGPGIIVGRKGSVGKVCWSDEPFWPIDTAYYVVPKHESNLRWLYWSLLNTDLKRLDSATGVPGLNRHDVYSVPTNAPHPEEQSRIAAVLDTVDALIESSEAVLAKLRQVRAGLLHDLLTRGLDADGRLRDPDAHPEQFKDSPLGRIPREWEVDRLSRFIASAEYGISTSLESEGKLPVLRMNNFANGEAILDDIKFATMAVSEKLLLKRGDVLFNRTNSYEHVGRTGIWRGQIERATFASYLVRLNPKASLLNSEFLNLVLNTPESQLRMRQFATPAVQQVNINPTSLQLMLVAIPSSVKEQQAIVDLVTTEDVAISSEIAELTKLRHLKSGLMTDLLEGRVRVPEDLPSQP